jgi:hypothetical protein
MSARSRSSHCSARTSPTITREGRSYIDINSSINPDTNSVEEWTVEDIDDYMDTGTSAWAVWDGEGWTIHVDVDLGGGRASRCRRRRTTPRPPRRRRSGGGRR